jgi:hypothetical protein
MSIIFMDGFDLYNSSAEMARRGWVTGAAAQGTPQTGRFGTGQAARMTSSNNNRLPIAITSDDTISVGLAIKFDSVASFSANGSEFLWFRSGSTDILRVGVTSSGHLRIGRGDFTSNLVAGSAAGLIVTGAWNYLEVELTRNASTGAVNLYLNGTLVASASSANTGASSIDNVALSGGFCNFDFDDMYIVDAATKLGEVSIQTIRPSADTATKDWTRSVGSDNYANVDDATVDGDTTYNSSGTVSQKDLFDLVNLSGTPSSVKAVNLVMTARKDNSDLREIRTNMKNGSTTTNGTTRTLSTSYVMYSQIYETNPDDSAAFDGTDINAMQLGYEVVT